MILLLAAIAVALVVAWYKLRICRLQRALDRAEQGWGDVMADVDFLCENGNSAQAVDVVRCVRREIVRPS